jgi:hypothetical protein
MSPGSEYRSTLTNAWKDMVISGVTLESGWNRLLLKIANQRSGIFGFYCRLSDSNGNAVPGLIYSTEGGTGKLAVQTKAMADIGDSRMPVGFREWPYVGAAVPMVEKCVSIWPELQDSWNNGMQASDFRLNASGGKPPYKWSISAGKLPDGLTLLPDGRMNGRVGQFAHLGDWRFIVKVTDAVGSKAMASLTIPVKERPNKNYEQSRLTALVHAPEKIPVSELGDFARLMKRQGYYIAMPISYGNGDWVYRWPCVFEPNNPLGDVIGNLKKALDAENVKMGMYIGNLHASPQFAPDQAILMFEDAMKKYQPAAFWCDWLGIDYPSIDALFSMVKTCNPETLIVLNGTGRSSSGDWDVLCVEDMSYKNFSTIWGMWPGEFGRLEFPMAYASPKQNTLETWRLMLNPEAADGVECDWRQFLKLQISLIGEGYIANMDHSYYMGGSALKTLTDSHVIRNHMRMANWANPAGIVPLYTSYTQVNPGPLPSAAWGYNTLNIIRDKLYLHFIINPRGKTGLPKTNNLKLSLIASKVNRVVWMNTGKPQQFTQKGKSLSINLAGVKQDEIDTILCVEFKNPLPPIRTQVTTYKLPKPALKPGNIAFRKPAKLMSVDSKRILHPSGETNYSSKGNDGYPSTIAAGGYEWAWSYYVDLQLIYRLQRVSVHFSKTGFASEYRVLLSADNINWVEVAYVKDNTEPNHDHMFAAIEARYVKIEAVKPNGPDQLGGQMAISEMEAYE